MNHGKPITANTVGELIAALQTLDPDMKTGHNDFMGSFSPGITLHPLALMKHKQDATYAAAVDDPVWKKKRSEFHPPFMALCKW